MAKDAHEAPGSTRAECKCRICCGQCRYQLRHGRQHEKKSQRDAATVAIVVPAYAATAATALCIPETESGCLFWYTPQPWICAKFTDGR